LLKKFDKQALQVQNLSRIFFINSGFPFNFRKNTENMYTTFARIIVFLLLFSSCVTSKKYNGVVTDLQDCGKNRAELETQLATCNEDKRSAIERLDQANLQLESLRSDSLKLHADLQKNTELNQELQTANDALLKEKNELLDKASNQSKSLTSKLQQKQTELDQKQSELQNKELNINALTNELKMRMYRVNELEHILHSKDSITNNLRKKISDALVDFNTSELTVERKNGKVYVSMADKLLFKSGSAEVDSKGKEALKKIAEVLIKNNDIQIVVEGHTDNEKLQHETYPQNNWDLSVLRATAIVKILTNSKVEAARIIAAGRGEFYPVAENGNKEGRAKNRRTELILTPKMDELLKVLDSQ